MSKRPPVSATAFVFGETRVARFDGDRLVLLDDQDCSIWRNDEITLGNEALRSAMQLMVPAPFQLQAIIASHHIEAWSNSTPSPPCGEMTGPKTKEARLAECEPGLFRSDDQRQPMTPSPGRAFGGKA